jgi:hypothetical protein
MSDKVTVKVSYEYFTEKTNEPKLSKPFEIKLIISEDINEIIVNINKLCKYKKQEDRTYYRLFNLETGLFLTKTSELMEIIKQKKNLTMRNCSVYAKQMIELFREEEQRYKLGKNINIENNTNNNNIVLEESKTMKPTSNILENETKSSHDKLGGKILNFEKNLKCDLFAEEFISYEGIKYFVSFIEYTSGNICAASLKTLQRLLEFESSNDYVSKNDQIIDTIYSILMKNYNIKCNTYSISILMNLISQDQAKANYLLNVSEEYSKKSVTKIFSQIVELLSKYKENELRKKTLVLINVLLNFCGVEKFDKLKMQLTSAGIYETLEAIVSKDKIEDKEWNEQLSFFQMKTGKIISGTEYELKVYQDEKKKNGKKMSRN